MVHCPHGEKNGKFLSQSALPVAPNSFLLAHTLQKWNTYPAKDVIPSIIPKDHQPSSQTQFQQFLHTTANQGMDYCLRNMETTKTLQKIKGWSEPVPSHSPKDHPQARKHHRYIQETKPPCKNKMANISHVNAHSITNKVSQFQLEICDRNTDICAITEMWIKQDDIDAVTKEVPLQG